MKIVIAPDSFKDSLSAYEVSEAIEKGLRKVLHNSVSILKCPMADGGEGSISVIMQNIDGGQLRYEQVKGPLNGLVNAKWYWISHTSTAIIEMAEASGLQLVPIVKRNPCITSTYGTGQLITAALDAGAKKIILFIGGSATNDAGVGALQSLGVSFLNILGQELPSGGLSLAKLAHIDMKHMDPRLRQVEFKVASDVTNPLCGTYGASHVFGQQKGASPEEINSLDSSLKNFSDLCKRKFSKDYSALPGSGAAGGLGFSAKTFFNADFCSGSRAIASIIGLEKVIEEASLVITGEGRLDKQTLYGKTISVVASIAKKKGVPVIALAGSLGSSYQSLYPLGVSASFSICEGPTSLKNACRSTFRLLSDRSTDVIKLWLMDSRSKTSTL